MTIATPNLTAHPANGPRPPQLGHPVTPHPDNTERERVRRRAEIDTVMESPRTWLRRFYILVGLIALVGQTGAAVGWLDLDLKWDVLTWGAAAVAVATLEVGGIAILGYAAARRRLNERALLARAVSAGVAAFAVTINWVGHRDANGDPTIEAYFFAGMSALGYLVYLIDSEARRRDRLRELGRLPAPPPAYPLGMWLRHPAITRRARALAKANPDLGTYSSYAQAEEELRREQRNAELGTALRELLAEGGDARMAKIAALTYDLDEIAAELRARADYAGLAERLGEKLTADAVLTGTPAGGFSRGRRVAPKPEPKAEPEPGPQNKVEPKPDPEPQKKAPSNAPTSGAPGGRRDPYTHYAEQIEAVQTAIPDWRTRSKAITAEEVRTAAGASQGVALTVKYLIEAKAERDPVAAIGKLIERGVLNEDATPAAEGN